MEVASTGIIGVSCSFLRAQVNPINSSSSEIARRRIKDQKGGSWWRARPVRLSGGGVCHEAVSSQDPELGVERAPGPAGLASKGESAGSSYAQTRGRQTRPASSGHRSSCVEDGRVGVRVWPAGRGRTVISHSLGGGVAPRQDVRVARPPAESTASDAGHLGPDPTWGRRRARCRPVSPFLPWGS